MNEFLGDLVQKGVGFCKFNNSFIVENCDIVFLCVGPHHVRYVIDDLRGRIKPHVLIYSLVLGFPALKLSSILHHKKFFKPSFEWTSLLDEKPESWPIADDIEKVFSNESLMKLITLESENSDSK